MFGDPPHPVKSPPEIGDADQAISVPKVGAVDTATAYRIADKILHSPYMVKHLMQTKKAFIAESLVMTGGDGGT